MQIVCDRVLKIIVVMMMKDEGFYILDWIVYYCSFGVMDFVVFINDCFDLIDYILCCLNWFGFVYYCFNCVMWCGLYKSVLMWV